jgi:cobalt-zinc-cadmium efflux system protein
MQSKINPALQKKFILSILLTSIILVVEVIGGLISGSLALLSDAAHVFMDIFALVLSFLAMRLAARPADDRHSYGWNRAEVVAALINGASLVVIAIGIWVEAYKRFLEPLEIRSSQMLTIAIIGLVVNLVVIYILGGHYPGTDPHKHTHADDLEHQYPHDRPGPRGNLNLHGAFLHVLGDTISSVGVIIAALLIRLTGANWIDPLISILIGIIIVISAVRLLRSALHILLEGVPEGLSVRVINERLRTLPIVTQVHDLHIWSLSSDSVALSAHVTLDETQAVDPEIALERIRVLLDRDFNIQHTTIQFEKTPCQDGHGGCN